MVADTVDFCPGTLYGGGCNDLSCSFQHDVRICDLCVVVCSPASNYDSHIQGRLHLAKLQAVSATTRLVNESARKCIVCSKIVSEIAWSSHLASEDHKKQQNLAVLRASYEQSEVNKRDVTISHADTGVDLGVVSLVQATEGVRVDVTVSTQSPAGISIIRTEVRSRIPNHSSLFAVSTTSPSLVLVPYQPLQYSVFFRHALHGRYEARLEFTFQAPGQDAFVIARRLLVVVSNAAERDLLKPVKPFERGRRAEWNHEAPVLVGQAPKLGDKTNWARDLPQYHIPPPLLDILRGRSPEEVFAQLKDEYFPVPLSQPNHAQYFQFLLWIEENRMADDLRMYDMVGVEFGQKGRLNTLYVHGLAEKRPSVTINDTILAQAVDGGPTHKGVVHEISQERVCVHFHGSFEAGPGRRFNVRFQLNRTSLRREHQALFAPTSSSQRLLFPVPGFEGLERPLRATENAIALFNGAIGGNFPQLRAVKSILSLRAGMAPFIVYGPPGTGKTVTIVEAITQILHRDPNARIMACAPSNSAADILAQRLCASKLTPDEMFRCNAIFRDPSSVPPEILEYTFRKGPLFGHPSLSRLAKFKVIVTTCINASFAYNLGLTVGHFTHIFVDEAGQASEPEVLIPIKPLSLDSTRIILSGDPKQLGPVVRSSVAREFGLEKSYLERLMERPVYSDERGRGTSYVKLTKNYRSHEGIIHFSNEKFYDGELEVCGNPDTINAYLNSPQLATPRFPVVFHAISGRNDREASSPSYFNIDEAIQVKAYVDALLKDHRFPLKQTEIGVITPYHAQVRKIRRLLRENGIMEVKVGSVEEFQGQERRVVIVSTVRSSGDLLAYDAKFALGFLSNARRFNVAMTRAQALLLVIGDSAILSVDPLWRAFMNYVYLHNGWRGDEPTWDVNAPVISDADYADELREAMAAEMNTVIAQQPAEEDIEAEANVDRNVWMNEDNTDW